MSLVELESEATSTSSKSKDGKFAVLFDAIENLSVFLKK